jgi:hypothetical protein
MTARQLVVACIFLIAQQPPQPLTQLRQWRLAHFVPPPHGGAMNLAAG